MALSTRAFSVFNVRALKRIPEAFALATARSISLIASRNLLDGEERRRYTFLFWYATTVACVVRGPFLSRAYGIYVRVKWFRQVRGPAASQPTVSVTGPSFVGRGFVCCFLAFQFRRVWKYFQCAYFTAGFVVFFGVMISTVLSEPREKLIRESRVNCNEEKKLPEDSSEDSSKSRAVANQRRSVCFSITFRDVDTQAFFKT